MKAIRFRFEVETTLDPIWYDEGWHQELLADGGSEEQALRLLLREGWDVNWTSIVEAMIGGLGSQRDGAARFANELVKSVEVVDV